MKVNLKDILQVKFKEICNINIPVIINNFCTYKYIWEIDQLLYTNLYPLGEYWVMMEQNIIKWGMEYELAKKSLTNYIFLKVYLPL